MNLIQKAFFAFATKLVSPERAARGWARRVAAFLVILAATTIPVWGQATKASGEKSPGNSIHGTVSTKQENAGSDLSGITVTLTTAPPDGNPLTAVTDEAGRYEFKSLRPGSYTVSIAQAGFKAVKKQINLAVGQAAVQDITLELETVNEQVEVNEQTQVISTESGSNPEATRTHRDLVAL